MAKAINPKISAFPKGNSKCKTPHRKAIIPTIKDTERINLNGLNIFWFESSISYSDLIGVGQPVTRLPPHRPLCAELPHKVPQSYPLRRSAQKRLAAVLRSEICSVTRVSIARTQFPLQTAQLCPPLPHVTGVTVSEYCE